MSERIAANRHSEVPKQVKKELPQNQQQAFSRQTSVIQQFVNGNTDPITKAVADRLRGDVVVQRLNQAAINGH